MPTRSYRPSPWGKYKLYPQEVRRIRALRAKGTPVYWLAMYYGISSSHVTNICKRRFWRRLR